MQEDEGSDGGVLIYTEYTLSGRRWRCFQSGVGPSGGGGSNVDFLSAMHAISLVLMASNSFLENVHFPITSTDEKHDLLSP